MTDTVKIKILGLIANYTNEIKPLDEWKNKAGKNLAEELGVQLIAANNTFREILALLKHEVINEIETSEVLH